MNTKTGRAPSSIGTHNVDQASTSSCGHHDVCGDSGLGSSEHGHQRAGAQAQCCGCMQQGLGGTQSAQDVKSPNQAAKEDWMAVLEALETVGEDEMLRKLEQSIMTGSVPKCSHGDQCRPPGTSSYTNQSQAPSILQPTAFKSVVKSVTVTNGPATWSNTVVRQPSSASSTAVNSVIMVQGGIEQTIRANSQDSDRSTSGSSTGASAIVGGKPAAPPKPPYHPTPLSAPTFEQDAALRAATVNASASTGSLDPADPQVTVGGGGHVPLEIIRVTLFKCPDYNDFGFSVSDGVNQKGVFINKIRPGGPADLCGNVKPYDKLLQVNGQGECGLRIAYSCAGMEHLDCILAVPLLLSATDRIDVILCRDPQFVSAAIQREKANRQPILEEDETDSVLDLKDSSV